MFRCYPYSLKGLKHSRTHVDLRSCFIFNTPSLTSNCLFIAPSFPDDVAQGDLPLSMENYLEVLGSPKKRREVTVLRVFSETALLPLTENTEPKPSSLGRMHLQQHCPSNDICFCHQGSSPRENNLGFLIVPFTLILCLWYFW